MKNIAEDIICIVSDTIEELYCIKPKSFDDEDLDNPDLINGKRYYELEEKIIDLINNIDDKKIKIDKNMLELLIDNCQNKHISCERCFHFEQCQKFKHKIDKCEPECDIEDIEWEDEVIAGADMTLTYEGKCSKCGKTYEDVYMCVGIWDKEEECYIEEY